MTREEAREIITRHFPSSSTGKYDDLIEALKMALKALEATRWIPCDERLPEVNKMVLTINNHLQCNVLSITVYDTWHERKNSNQETALCRNGCNIV
jgi:hypothetical protein